MIEILIGLAGIILFMCLAWCASVNRRRINWRVVFWGLFLQFAFAGVIFKLPLGYLFFHWVNSAVIKFISFAKEGMYFLFGPLAVSPGTTGPGGANSLGFILAFRPCPQSCSFPP